MKNRWNKMSSREKAVFLIDLLTFIGVLVLYLLYFLRILDYNATVFAWCLYPFHYFITAYGEWKTDRDMAAYNIMLGCFVSLFSLIGLLSFLMAYF